MAPLEAKCPRGNKNLKTRINEKGPRQKTGPGKHPDRASVRI